MNFMLNIFAVRAISRLHVHFVREAVRISHLKTDTANENFAVV